MPRMEAFNAKKVNRHVLKALAYLSEEEPSAEIHVADIIHHVKYTIRNTNPVRDLEQHIRRALKNNIALNSIEKVSDFTYRLNVPAENVKNAQIGDMETKRTMDSATESTDMTPKKVSTSQEDISTATQLQMS